MVARFFAELLVDPLFPPKTKGNRKRLKQERTIEEERSGFPQAASITPNSRMAASGRSLSHWRTGP